MREGGREAGREPGERWPKKHHFSHRAHAAFAPKDCVDLHLHHLRLVLVLEMCDVVAFRLFLPPAQRTVIFLWGGG